MKLIIFTLSLVLTGLTGVSFAQVSVNTDGSPAEPSAMLDVKSTTCGVLVPRMTFIQRNAILSPAEGLAVFCTDCSPSGTGVLCMYQNGQWINVSWNCPAPNTPSADTHVSDLTQVIWKWLAVPIATGYRWNTVNDYASATDMGLQLQKTETGLTCETAYTRYVWAYNNCGNSVPVTVSQSTFNCCGHSFSKNHLGGAVAPVNKNVTYETVDNVPGENAKCWITRNLGADRQALAYNDNSEPSAGWYWQFNRMQGYRFTTQRYPNTTWITSIVEPLDWTSANDPCTIELGSPYAGVTWRIPTYTEWFNVDNVGGWTNPWVHPWNSLLKLHCAGHLDNDNGLLSFRGSAGYYWSSTKINDAGGYVLVFDLSGVGMTSIYKSVATPLRCIRVQ